jgi:hypothetical protein
METRENKYQEQRVGKSKNILSEPVALILSALVCFSCSLKATTYTTQNNGNYTVAANWKIAYPGNFIQAADTVYINTHTQLNTDIIVKGTLIIRPRQALTGSRNIVVMAGGSVHNHGIAIVKAIVNKGTLHNHHILETEADIINSGWLHNYHSIISGNIFENTGTIDGKWGSIMANARFVNIGPGNITGTTDVCSNNFSSMNGSSIDSTTVSFCGSRIFTSAYLTASIKTEGIQLKLHNTRHADNKEYLIEKSTDGSYYTAIDTVKIQNAEAMQQTGIIYTDTAPVINAAVLYRVKIIARSGAIKQIAPLEISNLSQSLITALEE